MWNFSQPYRTETWYNKVKNCKLKTPVCIPSYNRPDAPIFKCLQNFDKDEVYIFIRPTDEQRNLYKNFQEKFNVIELPDWVNEVGTTREAIVQWSQNQNYKNIFMFDDRITAVNYLIPQKSAKTGKLSLAAAKNQNLRDGLLVWEKILTIYPFTLSCCSHKGFSYYPENIDASYVVNGGNIAAAIAINVQDFKTYDIHYKSTNEVGFEDLCIVLDVMEKGLPTCKITDLEYDEVTSDKIIVGGNHTPNTTLLQRSESKLKILWENYFQQPYPSPHLQVYVRKIKGIPYPYIKWGYWKEFYSKHSVKSVNLIPGDLYHIPGDTGKPWRFNKMVEYIGNFPDEIGPIMTNYFKSQNATPDDKLWWVFLYSTCYCMGSALVMSKQLDYKTVCTQDLEKYWAENKAKLIFQTDRRYIKNMNQFTEMVNEFLTRTGKNLYKYISQFLTSDPEKTYKNLYDEISKWKYYGRFGTILFIFNLCKMFPEIEVESLEYDWKTGATTTSAIFNARYEDQRANDFDAGKISLTPNDIKMLDASLKITTDALQKQFPQKKWNIIYVSSDLCSFRKLFKGVRYQGYYVDRQQEEIQELQQNYPEFQNLWEFIWEARSKHINNQLLGELNGWKGIRKNRCKLFLNKGYVGSDPAVNCDE